MAAVFWAIVKPLLRPKLAKRLFLLGEDFTALRALVPADRLPPSLGGSCAAEDGPDRIFARLLDAERATGMIGGWALPLQVDDPTGARRRTVTAAAVALAAEALAAAALEAEALAAAALEAEALAAAALAAGALAVAGASLAVADASLGSALAPTALAPTHAEELRPGL